MATTNNALSLSSKKGKELHAQLQPLKLGDKLYLDGFLTGLNQQTVAHCTEVEAGKFWQFALYWCGVHIQNVVAEVQGTDLVLENLGS
jgi:hypothetical protein